MKALVWLPILLESSMRRCLLTRRVFLWSYSPQSEGVRKAEEQVRNGIRLADYYAKRALHG